MPYREWQPLKSPAWLIEDMGEDLEAELGGAKDDLQERIRQGVRARFPDASPTDGLPAIGGDRQLPRGYQQDDAAYAETLKSAWDLWAGTDEAPGGAGSPAGMLRELKRQGFWPATIVQDNGRYTTLDDSGVLVSGWLSTSVVVGRPNWRFDDRNDFWSRFAIIFGGATPVPPVLCVRARATFAASSSAVGTWNVPWDDAHYEVLPSVPTSLDGSAPFCAVDETQNTRETVTVVASGPFTGYVDLIGYLPGQNPLCSPSQSTRNALNKLAKLWKPGNVTYTGAVAIVKGRTWGWPKTTWGAPGLKWGGNVIVYLDP